MITVVNHIPTQVHDIYSLRVVITHILYNVVLNPLNYLVTTITTISEFDEIGNR